MGKTALDYALIDVHNRLRETRGKNRSREIDRMNRFAGNGIGDPYCAAGVSWCFHLAGAGKAFPYSGGSQFLRGWFDRRGLLSFDAQDLREWEGALFGWTLPSGLRGHVGFVRGRLTEAGRVVAIQTAEYNTGPGGGRDGEGAFSLRRTVPLHNGHRLWFLNVSDIPGGAWWVPRR